MFTARRRPLPRYAASTMDVINRPGKSAFVARWCSAWRGEARKRSRSSPGITRDLYITAAQSRTCTDAARARVTVNGIIRSPGEALSRAIVFNSIARTNDFAHFAP